MSQTCLSSTIFTILGIIIILLLIIIIIRVAIMKVLLLLQFFCRIFFPNFRIQSTLGVRVPFGQLEILFFGKIKSAVNRRFAFQLKRNFEKWGHFPFSFLA